MPVTRRLPARARSVLAVLTVLLSICAAALPSHAVARPAGRLVPASGALFGAFVAPTGSQTWQARQAELDRLESQLGRRLDIDHAYYSWKERFPRGRERGALRDGRIPLISWNGDDTTGIRAGRHDALIKERAAGVKQLGAPVFMRWAWEMDTQAKKAWGSPSDYVAAWRRIRAIFDRAGATNAVWVWCPTAYGFANGRAPQFYPGDDAVDWVCADGYNWAPKKHVWRSFADIYEPFYRYGSARDKPMMVGEFGAMERAPGEKAQWLDDARHTLKARFPGIAAVVYFDSLKKERDGSYDWRVDTSTSSFAAYKAMSADPYFRPRH